MGRLRYILLLALAALLVQGCRCRHDDEPHGELSRVMVEFDTSACPDADPGGMAVLFFPVDGSRPWRFDFRGTQGDSIELPAGTYRVMAYNNDTYRVLVDDADSFDGTTFSTPATTVFEGIGYLSRAAIPGGPPEGSEEIRRQPQIMWTATIDEVTIPAPGHESGCTVVVPLRQSVGRITVTADPVLNIEGISQLCAIVTGMGGTYRVADALPGPPLTAVPFSINRPTPTSNSLTGTVNTFGKADWSTPSWLIIYLWLTDGQKFYYKFNITQQLRGAPDPLDIHIDLGQITVPEVIGGDTPGGSGGIDVGVDDWDYIIIDLTS